MSAARRRTDRVDSTQHVWGTPSERMTGVLRLGNRALDLFLSTLPAGTSRARARVIMQRNASRGRRFSKVIASLSR